MDIARKTVLNILIEYDKAGVFPNLSLKKYLRQIASERDRAFVSALLYGVLEKRILLDYYISKVSSVKIKKINVAVINILRMGLYQIAFMSTPSSAACNTSVDLAKNCGQYKSAAFVNAILRKLSSEYENIAQPDDKCVKYSVSPDIADVIISSIGEDGFDRLMQYQPDDRSVYIAVNTNKISADKLISLLKLEGVTATYTDFDGLLKASSASFIENSSAFKAGLYHVVGLPSFICAKTLSPSAGENVIDMCAAPGGKTFTLSYLSDDAADIRAFDLHEHKIKNLKDDCKRLGIKSVKCDVNDSSVFNPALVDFADKILCDVPCSGLGMIFNKPDIKYNSVDFESLTELQYKILSNAARYLKKGGTLIYSTCTINSSENEGVVSRLISENKEIYFSENTYIYNEKCGEYTFLPHVDNTDGFYIAVLKKN